ncbi:MAG: hypothetical protein ACI85I_000260 [Arenicella sp.]
MTEYWLIAIKSYINMNKLIYIFLLLSSFSTFSQVGPGGLSSDLKVWLKADKNVTGVTPISSWVNQAGVTPATSVSGTAPNLLTNGLNFNPTIDFDGTDDNLQITGGILGTDTWEHVWVYSVLKSTNTNGTVIYESETTSNLGLRFPDGSNRTSLQVASQAVTVAHASNPYEFNIWTHSASTNRDDTPSAERKTIYRNGENIYQTYRPSTLVGTNSNFLIGGGFNDGLPTTRNFQGQIAEIIVYNAIPSPLEQERVHSYLAIKYGFTKNSENHSSTPIIDERDYFASDSITIIWDYSANTAYHNNVAGIGRDDDSELNQQKSKSSINLSRVTMDKGGVFTSDKDFIVWGNDGAKGISADISATYSARSNRVWRADVTGGPGAVDFTIDLNGLGFNLHGAVAGDFALLIDSDGTFATTATAHTAGATLSDGILSFTGVSFTDGDFFSIATIAPSPGPGGVNGDLHVWFKADKDVIGISPVSSWGNQAGVTLATNVDGTAPDLLTNELNFNPVIDFDGAADNLQITGGILDSDTWPDVWVYSVSRATSNSRGTLFYEDNVSGSFNVRFPDEGFTYIETGTRSLRATHGTPFYDFGMWTHSSVYSTRSTPAGDRKAISKNGEYIGITYFNSLLTGDNQDFLIGGGYNDGSPTSNSFQGQIAEILVYNEMPTPLEQELIQSYLAIKYGFTKNSADNTSATSTVDERDYFASDETVIWDYSANSTYHNEVAGIGRDDDSELDQQKSKSSINLSRVTMDKGSAFANDKDFIVWGDDAAAGSNTDVPAAYSARSKRVWKIDTHGTPGVVSGFSINLKGLGLNLKGATAADFALLIDSDVTFLDAAIHTAGAVFSNDILSFTGITFNDNDFFSIATKAVSPGPGGLSGDLIVWLKANKDVTGTTSISSWENQTGLIPATNVSGTAPSLLTNQANFNPVIDFDGTDNLQITGGVVGIETWPDLWVYSVFKADNVSNGTIIHESDGNGKGMTVRFPNNGGTNIYIGAASSGNTPHGSNPYEFNMWLHSSSATTRSTPAGDRNAISRNGEYIKVDYRYGFMAGANNDFMIGAGYNDGLATTNNFQGEIAEILVYNAMPTPFDQELIQSYLAIKYGFTKNSADNTTVASTVDERDYFASDEIVIWDYSVNSAYHNNVAGIGRDDGSELSQPKSKSSINLSRVTMDKGGAFPNDKDFIIWGNNGLNGTSTDVAAFDFRSNRVWKVAVRGTPGLVDFSIDLDGLGLDLDGVVAGSFALLIDIDGDGSFMTGTTTHTIGATYDNGLLSFTDVPFNDGDCFAIGEGNISLAPGGVNLGLNVWLKADKGISGATPITAWSNIAGATPAATNVSGTAPNLLENHINFNPAIDFNGTDDNLQIAGGLLGTNTWTNIWVYSVFKSTSNKTSGNGTIIHETDANGSMSVRFPDGNGRTEIYQGASSTREFHSTDGSWYDVWTHASSTNRDDPPAGDSKAISRNGGYLKVDYRTSFAEGGGNDFLIGAGYGDGLATTKNFRGQIAEIAIYNTIPTALEQERVQTNFAIKYSLTKNSADNGSTGEDERDYFGSDETVIWDYSATPAAYHNDVIGIGRDVASGLLQKQSKTQDDSLIVYVDALAITNAVNAGTMTNDISYLVVGSNRGMQQHTDVAATEMPTGIVTRLEREWRVQNTNFSDDFSIEVEWDSTGSFNINDIRLLVDDDGDFSNATVLSIADGLVFSLGSIVISGINTTHIPLNSTRFITIGSTNINTPLPIELLSFDAIVIPNNQVELAWQTAFEINNDYFTIERSMDGQEWKPIAEMKGAGNSKTIQTYQDMDEEPYLGTSYYRLKQTDFDGKFEYSRVRSVTIDEVFDTEINIYPNPTESKITITGNVAELNHIQVFNVLGQDVTSLTIQIRESEKELVVDLSSLSAGMYCIKTKNTISKVHKQ